MAFLWGNLHTLHRQQHLPIALNEAWTFFSDPRNLPLITPASLDFVITSEVPAKMYAGLLISYQVRPLWGIPVRWVTEITQAQEPYLFVDEQRFGPYRLWHHRHLFREVAQGVEVQDIVTYVLPYGPLGDLLNPLLVRPQLDWIFNYRQQVLSERFGGPPISVY
jgi:ligand-binding SRPBCC domain-containing protein